LPVCALRLSGAVLNACFGSAELCRALASRDAIAIPRHENLSYKVLFARHAEFNTSARRPGNSVQPSQARWHGAHARATLTPVATRMVCFLFASVLNLGAPRFPTRARRCTGLCGGTPLTHKRPFRRHEQHGPCKLDYQTLEAHFCFTSDAAQACGLERMEHACNGPDCFTSTGCWSGARNSLSGDGCEGQSNVIEPHLLIHNHSRSTSCASGQRSNTYDN
jgi:hypothetical protein